MLKKQVYKRHGALRSNQRMTVDQIGKPGPRTFTLYVRLYSCAPAKVKPPFILNAGSIHCDCHTPPRTEAHPKCRAPSSCPEKKELTCAMNQQFKPGLDGCRRDDWNEVCRDRSSRSSPVARSGAHPCKPDTSGSPRRCCPRSRLALRSW